MMSACASKPPVIQDEPPDWALEFDRPIEHQVLISEELLVVATTRHLYGIDPATGTRLWRQRNIAATGSDLISAGKDSYLLVNDAAGGAFDDRDTNILALDQQTGEIVWESKMLEGKVLQGTLDEKKDILFFTKVQKAHGDDRGFLSGTFGRKGLGSGFEQQPHFGALDVSTGRLLWSQAFSRAVRMRPNQRRQLDDNSDWTAMRTFDLGLYHPPLSANGMVCLTYDGIHCYDAATGAPAWENRHPVIENELALSYANPVASGSSVITASDHRVRAYDLTTGKKLWQSRKFDIIPELLVDKNIVYGQLGGRFLNIDKEKWKWKGDFGVFALNKSNGKTLWKYKKANDAVTNILVYGDEVWLADENNLIALNRFTGKKKHRIRHKFKDPPVYAALNEAGRILLVGEGEAATFHPQLGTSEWHVRHEPIRPGAWRRFADGLLRASGNILKFGSFVLSHGGGLLPSLAVPLGSVDFKIINTKSIVSRGMGRSGRRMAYQSGFSGNWEGNQSLSGNFQYFVTKPDGTDHVVLAMVNLSNGKTERMIRMDADRPNLVLDESNNKVFEIFGRRLVALPLQTSASDYPSLTQQPTMMNSRSHGKSGASTK